MPKIFRTMLIEDDLPAVGTDPHMLGARTPTPSQPSKAVDITPDEAGNVHPNSGGLSVARSVHEFPPHIVPKRFKSVVEGASGSDSRRIWSMGKGFFFQGVITRDLNLMLKPHNTAKQQLGLIEPAQTMTLNEYQIALASTRGAWSLDEPIINATPNTAE